MDSEAFVAASVLCEVWSFLTIKHPASLD